MKNSDLVIVNVPIEQLIAAEYNPRKWNDDALRQLTESVKRFGLIDPIIVNKAKGRKNIVIGGHFRLHVATRLGHTQVPVVYLDIPDINKEMELNIRLNKNQGTFDNDLLAQFFTEHILTDIGFKSDELDKMFGLGEEDDDEFDVDEALEKIVEPRAKFGDIYELGKHRLMCGDSTNAVDVRKLMGGVQADMVFTDPPYNVAYEGKTKDLLKIDNDKMSQEQFYTFLDDCIRNMLDHCNGVFYICMSSKELASLKDTFEKNGGHWQSFIVWVKNTFTLSRCDWQNQYEPILYGWNKNKINHFFAGFRDEGNVWENLEKVKPLYDGETTTIKVGDFHLELNGKVEGRVIRKKDSVDIWYEKKPSKSTDHPTMKPVKLVVKAIKASSERNNIILDLFGGSGTTLIAAHQTGRLCYMMEYAPKYIDVIISRWEKESGEKAKKIN